MPPMLIELPVGQRDALRPLYEGFPGLHGCIDAALDGTMGRAWADDAARPTFAMVHLEFFMLGGAPSAPDAEAAVRAIDRRGGIVAPDASWEPLLRRVWGERLQTYTRVEFGVGEWDRARLRGFIDALADGFALRRITIEDAARFEELADSLVYNFASHADFIARGAGFGIEHEGRFVSGCASFAISPHSLEFDIQTHEDFRRWPRLRDGRRDDRALHRARAGALLGRPQRDLGRARHKARLHRARALHRVRAAPVGEDLSSATRDPRPRPTGAA